MHVVQSDINRCASCVTVFISTVIKPPFSSKLKGETLHSQNREIILHVYNYIKMEARERNRYSPEFFSFLRNLKSAGKG